METNFLTSLSTPSAMIRSFLTLALSVFLLAEASAQTTPAASKKATAKSTKVAARKAKKARRVALKTVPASPVVNDGWPALDEPQTAVASATTTDGGWATDVPATTSRGELDNHSISAAPGMPVHVRTSNGLTPYSVRPARKPAAETTLGN
jgi:hypothetical protein